MNQVSIALSIVAVSLLVVACGETPPEPEATAESSSALDQSGSGCVILNPVCPLFPSYGRPGWAPDTDGFGMDPASCMDRARQYSIWCGNPAGTATEAMWLDHGQPTPAHSHYDANNSVCIVSLQGCARYGWGPYTFGDDGSGSDVDPGRCHDRSKEWSDWCLNPPGVRTQSVFDVPGAAHAEWHFVAGVGFVP